MKSARPLLLALYGKGSATAMGLAMAARPVGDLVFMADLSDPRIAGELTGLPKSPSVIDTAGLDIDAIGARAKQLQPDGLITFSDSLLRTAAAVAQVCGLPFHSPETAEALVDKVRQRTLLRDAGVQSTKCVPVSDVSDLAGAMRHTGAPAVLKPRSGSESVDTCAVRSLEELIDRYRDFTGMRSGRDFVVEEYIGGDSGVIGDFWGDYVSVESLVADGDVTTLGITGKLPMAYPFRETGMFSPALLPQDAAADVIHLERAALRALGVREGVTHTEIKMTAEGPRLIEVNGRMGGHVGDLLRRSAGVNLMSLAIRIALRDASSLADFPKRNSGRDAVAFQYYLTPPTNEVAPGDPDIVDRLSDVRGVGLVDARWDPEWRPDWRAGTEWMLGTIYGSVPDHAGLREAIECIQQRMGGFWVSTAPAEARATAIDGNG